MKTTDRTNIAKALFSVLLMFLLNTATCQLWGADTLYHQKATKKSYSKFILPASCITYGLTSLVVPSIRDLDFTVRDFQPGHQVTKVDDYLIYVPLATDVILNLSGIQSKHKLRDKGILYLMSTGLNALIVYPTKRWTTRARPDASDFHSFPSGHTSNAFVGAEFFWQEYKDKSKLLASTGYIIAASTGFLRIRNNKHWLSDVITGAGTGILSTRLVYHFYPKISKRLFGDAQKVSLLPFSAFNGMGVSVVVLF